MNLKVGVSSVVEILGQEVRGLPKRTTRNDTFETLPNFKMHCGVTP